VPIGMAITADVKSDAKGLQPRLRMEDITKTFPRVIANDNVSLEVGAGEIHGLLGENGAGKTTLMNILTGVYKPDKGRIYLDGRPTVISSPRDALNLGICMVHQKLSLVERLTVAENLLLPKIREAPILVDPNAVESNVRALEDQYGMKLPDMRTKVWQLAMGERQRVEIVRALFRGATFLVLDEPTSLLTPIEAEHLITSLRQMAKQGLSIIFISHKLDEAMIFTDRITVLRKGKVMGKLNVSEATEAELIRLMMGSEITPSAHLRAHPDREPLSSTETPPPLRPEAESHEVLAVKDICALSDKGVPALRQVSFSMQNQEILGVAGIAGNGQRELAEVLVGLRKSNGGTKTINQRDMTNKSPKEIAKMGVGYVPEERLRYGVISDLSVEENLILRLYESDTFARRGLLDRDQIRAHAEKLIQEYSIATPGPTFPVKTLSGGNLQRLILAREFTTPTKLLIAAQPTAGLDIAAADFVHRKLIELRDSGTSILLISEDLAEVMEISDRIAVMKEGLIRGIFSADRADLQEIGRLMTVSNA